MSRKFRLAALLRLRKLQEDQAAADLGTATRESESARSRRERAVKDLTAQTLTGLSDMTTWRAAAAARSAFSQNVTLLSAVVATTAEAVRAREADWVTARIRAVPLEKLEERHGERVAIEDLRTEQLELDEAASRGAHTSDDDTSGEPS